MSPAPENKSFTSSTTRLGSTLRRRALDLTLVLILVMGAWGLGWRTARAYRLSGSVAHQPAFELQLFGVALMKACGRGEAAIVTGDREILPASTSQDKIDRAPVGEFLDGRRERVECGQIGTVASMPLDPMLRSSRSLIALTSAAWRVSRPNWTAIDALMGGLFALTIAAAYAIGRLGMGPAASTVLSLLFACSPLHLSALSSLRDYSKAPFFAIALLVCGVLARTRLTINQAIALSVAAGVVLGLGFGMRTDVAVYLPLILVTSLVFLPDSWARSWRTRVCAALLCLSAFLSIVWPILAANAGGNTAHWAVLGFSHEFDNALGVRPGPYRLNYFYNDSAVATIVTAFGQRIAPAGVVAVVDSNTYDAIGKSYLSALVTTFPADALVRLWAAVIKVANLPFSDAVSRVSEDGLPKDQLPSRLVRILELRRQWLSPLNGTGLAWLTIAIAGLAVVDLRLAALAFVSFCYLAGSSSIQFQPRHVFQLELLPLWMATFVVARALGLARRLRLDPRSLGTTCARRLPRLAACLAAIVAVVVLPLAAARLYQRGTAERLLAGYQSAPRERVALDPRQLIDGWTRLGASTLGDRADQPMPQTHAEMVVVQVSQVCGAESLDLRFTYDARPSSDFSRTVSVRRPHTGEAPVEVFMPVYYAGADLTDPHAYKFAGIDVPTAQASCVEGLFRLRDPSRQRLLLEAVLPLNWRDLSLFQSLDAMERPRTYAGVAQ